MERRNVCINVYCYDSWKDNRPPEKIVDFQRWLADQIAKIPPEHLKMAEINFYSSEDGQEIDVEYRRPETDEEMQERVERAQKAAAQREAKERATYEALKEKYEAA